MFVGEITIVGVLTLPDRLLWLRNTMKHKQTININTAQRRLLVACRCRKHIAKPNRTSVSKAPNFLASALNANNLAELENRCDVSDKHSALKVTSSKLSPRMRSSSRLCCIMPETWVS